MVQNSRNLKYFLIGLGVYFLGLIPFFIFASLGWPGEPDLCVATNTCLCETFNYDSLYRQPINTWANLFIVFFGLLILFQIGKATPTTDKMELDNPLLRPSVISITWGIVAVLIGLGSMFYHASMTMWGGFLDVFCMILLVCFLICFDLTRYFVWSQKNFLILLIVMSGVFGLLIYLVPAINVLIFTVLVFILIVFDTWILISTRKGKKIRGTGELHSQWFTRDWRIFAIGVIIWSSITIIWLLSNTGGPLCNPTSFFTGHTVWHFGDGLVIYIFFLYGRTERRDLELRAKMKSL
jgi:hypothetical protein